MNIAAVFLTYNEAHVLPRLLNSLDGHVTGAVVVDGGSTDGSAELVKEHFGDSSVTNLDATYMGKRAALMRHAQGQADYLLLVDPDHELVVTGPLPDSLDADAYMLTERYGNLRHRMPRLVKADRVWSYAGGPAHEYLVAPTDRPLDSWELLHHGDSRPAEEKRLITLAELIEQTAANPSDSRSQFYLANTLMELGRWDEAIEAYDRRLRMGGWDEELFCAQLYKGRCQIKASLWYEGRMTLLAAYLRRPQRAEPLMEICRSLNFPDDLLFVEDDAYPNARPR